MRIKKSPIFFLSTALVLLASISNVQAQNPLGWMYKKVDTRDEVNYKNPASRNSVERKSGSASKVLNPQEKLEYINMSFWEGFCDPCLKRYILLAIEKNNNARKASWQVEQYRQEVKKTFGKELPQLSTGVNYVGIHLAGLLPESDNKNVLAVPFLTNWELDILQKNRDATRSVEQIHKSYKYDEQGIYLSLVADVASSYVNILQYDSLIELQEQYTQANKELLERYKRLYIQGTIDAQKYLSQQRAYEDAKNSLEEFLKSRQSVINQLAVLIGEAPGVNLERARLDDFDYRAELPKSISSDIVFSRPDIKAAEARLRSSKLDIRVARKELFPTFRITGLLAFSTFAPGNFFAWESVVAYLVAGATQDIFKGGQKIAKLRIQKSIYEERFEEYKNTDLNALKEINDALYIIKQDEIIDKNTLQKLYSQKEDFKRTEHKYLRGVVSRLEVLLERQKLLGVQQGQVQSKTARLVNYITLYKTVGGDL